VAAPAIARGLGCDADRILAGLIRLWHRCWSLESDRITTVELGGVFGGRELSKTIEALVAHGFLEPSEQVFRVRGGDRYLRLRDSRRRGGKAAASNLKRGTFPGSSAGTKPELSPGRMPALSPNTEHRTPRTPKEEEPRPKITTAHIVTRPTTEPEGWGGEDFWRWFQFKRQEAGFVAEPGPPRAVNAWYSTALMTIGGNVEAIQEAVYRFGSDKHWQRTAPPLPWAAFAKCWTNFIPRGAVNAES
jgi:hypothetical protein